MSLCLQPSTFQIADGDLLIGLYECTDDADQVWLRDQYVNHLYHNRTELCLDIHAGTGPATQL